MSAKALIISNTIDSIVKFRSHVVKQLQSQGFEVHVAAPLEATVAGVEPAELHELGIQLHPISMNAASISPLGDLKMFLALRRFVKKLKPNCCLTYTIKPNTFGVLATRMAYQPCRIVAIMNGFGLTFLGTSLRSRVVRRIVEFLYRTSFRFASRVFFHNADDAALFIERGLVSQEKVGVVAGSGVDLSFFTPWELGIDKKRILFVGRLIREKGVRELIEATRSLRSEFPDLTLDIVGPIYPSPTAISELELAAWRKEKLIDYHGIQHDVRPFIRKASIVVLPSYREGLSRVLLEAAACGRAIITSDAPGCREAVIHGETGLLVPVADSAALVNALRELLSDPKRVQVMGERGRRLAEQKFGVQPIASEIVKALSNAA